MESLSSLSLSAGIYHHHQVEELGDSQLVAVTMQLIEEARMMARFVLIKMMIKIMIIMMLKIMIVMIEMITMMIMRPCS